MGSDSLGATAITGTVKTDSKDKLTDTVDGELLIKAGTVRDEQGCDPNHVRT